MHSKIEQKVQRFAIYPPPCPYICTVSPLSSSGTEVYILHKWQTYLALSLPPRVHSLYLGSLLLNPCWDTTVIPKWHFSQVLNTTGHSYLLCPSLMTFLGDRGWLSLLWHSQFKCPPLHLGPLCLSQHFCSSQRTLQEKLTVTYDTEGWRRLLQYFTLVKSTDPRPRLAGFKSCLPLTICMALASHLIFLASVSSSENNNCNT